MRIGVEQRGDERGADSLRKYARECARYGPTVHASEYLVRAILRASPETLRGRAKLKVLISLRRALVGVADPLLTWRVGGKDLLLPLSHELPFYRHDHPLYDRAIGRIAADAGGPIVDIGANVGDTAAEMRAHTDAPILCVEPDDRFFTILSRNAPQLEPIELEHACVAGADGSGKPLAEILRAHPAFAEPALVKIDTDGMDVPIVLANLDLLERVKPVLFFEYDPHFGATKDVFERLREIGYRTMDVYENTGELARCVELPGDIHDEYAGHGGARYADVCVRP